MNEIVCLSLSQDRVVIAVAYDCVDEMVYWTDITGPAISRARLSGGDVSAVVTTGTTDWLHQKDSQFTGSEGVLIQSLSSPSSDLESPEGIAIDHVYRLLFWTDSMRDTVEVSQLDGSQRRVLFDTDLVNPRPIVTNPVYG